MTKAITTVDQYIAAAPAERQATLKKVRQTIKAVLPEAVEKNSYQMPTYHQGENIVHFACAKQHLGFYPTPSAITAFQEDLQPYKTSKGAVQFPFAQPIPYELIAVMTAWRLAEVKNKHA